ncbi:hypothetical protein Tco_1411947 [Tanacetum coccineum]
MNMALVLMAMTFKLNYSTPTNNNKRTLSNPYNRQITYPGMNMGKERYIQMVGGNGGIANHNVNQTGNGNVVATRAGVNGNRNNGDIDEIEKVNANCILMANLKQALTSGTQSYKAPVYDPDRSAEQAQHKQKSLYNGRVLLEKHYLPAVYCNTPKSGLQRNVEYPRALLHSSIAQDMRTTTKRVV